jgi:hypothetical protein
MAVTTAVTPEVFKYLTRDHNTEITSLFVQVGDGDVTAYLFDPDTEDIETVVAGGGEGVRQVLQSARTYATVSGSIGSTYIDGSMGGVWYREGQTPTFQVAEKLVKVNLNVTLEVDPAEWDLAYGTGVEAAVVREDVREHIINLLNELTTGNHGAGDGAIKRVTPRRS